MNTTETTDIREYLEALANATDGPSIARFVLTHGQEFTKHHPNPRVKLGTPKECFANAGKLALIDERFVYVEGYAIGSIVPVHHAWCVDNGGRIVEPTWKKPGEAYFGVAFRKRYLGGEVYRSKHWGLIDTPWNNWRILQKTAEAVKRKALVNVGSL